MTEAGLSKFITAIVRPRAAALACAAALALAPSFGPAHAASLDEGAQNFKPFIVENIELAVAGAKELQAAVKSGDVKSAQIAWIKSRKGWESLEPVTGEYFAEFDKKIDSWPDAKQGYHAIEAALFAGKLDGLAAPVDDLVSNLAKVEKTATAKSFKLSAQRLLSGTANLAYEVGDEKSKGGESAFAGTSIVDMRQNVNAVEQAYGRVFAAPLKKSDAKLAAMIDNRLNKLKHLLQIDSVKSLDAQAVHVTGEELAALLLTAAPKLGLTTFKLGDEEEEQQK